MNVLVIGKNVFLYITKAEQKLYFKYFRAFGISFWN